MYTYSPIVLIKLDFSAPVMPVIAKCISTSFHPSILLVKNFAMESGLRRPFLSTSFWKSCAYFDSQFIAIGWLEIEQYAACCEQKWAATTTKPYIEGYTWRNILDGCAFAVCHHTQRKNFGLQSLLLRCTAKNLQVTEYSCQPNFLKAYCISCLPKVDHVIKLCKRPLFITRQ